MLSWSNPISETYPRNPQQRAWYSCTRFYCAGFLWAQGVQPVSAVTFADCGTPC